MKKRIVKDPVVIFFAVAVFMGCIADLCFASKYFSLPSLGFVINENFLNVMVEQKNYELLLKASVGITVGCFLGGSFFVLIKYRFSKLQLKHQKWNLVIGTVFFPLIVGGIAVSTLLNFSVRLSEKPVVQKEFVADKFTTRGSKSGVHYHLMFNRGETFSVDSEKYYASFVRQEFYTVYQGKILIEALPANQYRLAEEK